MLELAAARPLALGQLRAVYAHPERSDRLVKIVRPEAAHALFGPAAPWRKQLRRERHFGVYERELGEVLALEAASAARLPIARVHGMEDTDLGLGLVVDRIASAEGELAATLDAIIRRGEFDAALAQALEHWFESALSTGLIVSDLHPGNFAYGFPPGEAASRFVLIDGFGEKHALPLCSWSRAWNRRNTLRRRRRLLRHVEALRARRGR